MILHRSFFNRVSSTTRVALLALFAGVGCGGHSVPSEGETTDEAESGLSRQELLGKRIFEDTSLSARANESCASCHAPETAFAGNAGSKVLAVAAGSKPHRLGTRNTPTIMYAAFSPPFSIEREEGEDGTVEYVPTGGQFWDGRAVDLAEQAEGPFLNEREMGNPSEESVGLKLRDASYAPLFREVFGDASLDDPQRAFELAADAIASFEKSRTFAPFSSKFDAFLGGKAQLSEEEARGFELFKDPEKGNCISCHVGNPDSRAPQDWLFTDFTYDNLGLPRNYDIPDNADDSYYDLGLCEQEGIAKILPEGLQVEDLCGAFKVPTLRNVELTAPYGHNGYFTDLEQVVRFYVTRDTNPENWYPLGADGKLLAFDDLPENYRGNVNHDEVPYDRKAGEKPRLDDDEVRAVVAFLKTLTDRE